TFLALIYFDLTAGSNSREASPPREIFTPMTWIFMRGQARAVGFLQNLRHFTLSAGQYERRAHARSYPFSAARLCFRKYKILACLVSVPFGSSAAHIEPASLE